MDTNTDNIANGPGSVYSLHYQAASPGQTLTVRYTVLAMHDGSYGNVTLQAATLVSDNLPPLAAITTPTNQATFRAPANIPIAALASDADGSISKVEFFHDATKLGESLANPYGLTWSNVAPGNYVLTAKATDNRGATFTSPPVNVYVTIGGGILFGTLTNPPAAVNLTTRGGLDWGHWGFRSRASFDHKAGVTQLIQNAAVVGSSLPRSYGDNASSFTWTDGTPTFSADSTRTGIFVYGLSNGFQLFLPADPILKRLQLYVGLYGAKSRIQASLSDFSAAPYTDSTLSSVFGNAYGVYTIHYAAASAGQTLAIKYTSSALYDKVYGNVTWQAVTMNRGAPVIKLAPRLLDSPSMFIVPTESGLRYQCQFTDLLKPMANWQTFTEFIGDGTEILVSDPGILPAQRYYRVRLDF